MTKVKDLIEMLTGEDPELEVWLSRDSEGNGFSISCNGVYEGYVDHSDKFRADGMIDEHWFDEDEYSKEEIKETLDGMKKVLILYPV